MKRAIQISLMILMMAPILVQAQDVSRTWRTTAPTEGTTPVLYRWEVSAIDPIEWVAYATTEDTTVSISVPYNWEYVVRVQAEDAERMVSLWSPVSDPDVVGRPGTCGKPWSE